MKNSRTRHGVTTLLTRARRSFAGTSGTSSGAGGSLGAELTRGDSTNPASGAKGEIARGPLEHRRGEVIILRPMKLMTPCKAALALALVLCAGCNTRSISNSSYEATSRYGRYVGGYRGELSELDVVGVTPDAAITDADI